RERPWAEEAEGEHRLGAPCLPDDESHEQDDADREGADDRRARPPELVRSDQAPDDGEQATAHEAEAGQVEPGRRAVRLAEAGPGHRDRDQPDRDVDPEDPLPGEALGDGAADERPDRDGETGDSAPRAEGDGPTLTR